MQSPLTSKNLVHLSNEQITLLDKLAFDSIDINNDNLIFNTNDDNNEYDDEQMLKIQVLIQQRHEEKILKLIHFILFDKKYQNLIESALDIIYDSRIICTQTSSSSKRSFWTVPSASRTGGTYVCLKHYCPCRNFYDLAKSTSSKVLCKHLLAIRIGTAFGGLVKTNVVNDLNFVNILTEESSKSSATTNQYQQQYQKQHHHHHQQQQQQPETPSRFAPGFNMREDNF